MKTELNQYDKKIADEICHAVATNALSLRKILLMNPHFPSLQTIYTWRLKYKEFGDAYMKAKCAQMEPMADQLLDIADDGLNDTYIDENGNIKVDTDITQRARLRIDTRKWFLAKLAPKIYGDNAALIMLEEKVKRLEELLAKQE